MKVHRTHESIAFASPAQGPGLRFLHRYMHRDLNERIASALRFPCSSGRTWSVLLTVVLGILTTNCSSLYWKQRARDSADIFTVEFQSKSYGAALRAGPVKVGLNYKSEEGQSAGLRGGEVGQFIDSEFALFFMGSDRLKDMKKPEPAITPGDLPSKDEPGIPAAPIPIPSKPNAPGSSKKDRAPATASPLPSMLLLRRKNFQARSPFGTSVPFQDADPLFKKGKKENRFAPAHHFTQIEATIGAYYGIKIGVNLGELADWFLGFFGVDIFSDDLPDLSALYQSGADPLKALQSQEGSASDTGITAPVSPP